MGLREVSAILWRERHLLELLLFKLDEEQLVLAAGRTRWLPQATREVEMVLEEIRQTELERAVEVSRVALDLGLPAGASLRQLAEAAPAPWPGMLAEHREAFLMDLPATSVELQLQEMAYQAAPGAPAKVIQPSLVDFLR
jgi:hypothetical protein